MCGIYGIVGKTNTRNVLTSLRKLEYRGYDSCGVAYLYKNRSFLFKTIGNSSRLSLVVEDRDISCAIGHTRWATHGAVTPMNAHPHTSNKKRFYVAHNGVIDNYKEIIEKYKFEMKTQTDSEIIVHLLDMYSNEKKIIDAIREIAKELKGSFAVVILDKECPDKIFFIKNKSPLLIALNNQKAILASDQCVFDAKMSVTILNDMNYGYIKEKSYQIYSFNENERWNTFYKEVDTQIEKKTSHYMLDEIQYEPNMIESISKHFYRLDTMDFHRELSLVNEIVFVGAGSAYYAGCILKKLYEKQLNKRCYSVVASELSFFPLLHSNIIFIFLSQSGETADLCEGLVYLKNKNYKIISLCNNVNSSLGYKSDIIFPLFAKNEVAVASTKAFTAMVYVGRILLDKFYYCNQASIYATGLKSVLKRWEEIYRISTSIAISNTVFYLGKDLDFVLAQEGALKLREISYIPSFAFESGELKHGSIALIDRRTICIAVLSNIDLKTMVCSNLEEGKSRGASTFLISNCEPSADLYFEGDFLNLILCLQIIAYQTAVILNRNIDQPRNLAKSVTVL